jgi:uncharacterized protein (TIGR03790 family)
MYLFQRFYRMKWVIVLPLLFLASHCFAGGGPAGFIVVYNPNDANSVTVANHYELVRQIPERNMIPYPFPVAFTRATAWTFISTLRSDIASRGLTNQFQGIALAGMTPMIPWGEGTGEQDSLQSFIYKSPSYGQADYPTPTNVFDASNNAYAQPGNFTLLGPAATQALTPNMTFSGLSYWPVSYVGYTGKSGMTFSEALAYIDRAKSHDGTNAQGTIYWENGTSIRTSPRAPEVADCTPIWNARKLSYYVDYNGSAWFSNRSDIIGGITGSNGFNITGGDTYLPGAWVDNLTSAGGALNSLIPANSSPGPEPTLIPWIRAGVDGSSGTCAEPYAIGAKFPHGHINTHLAAGASMVEAFWESIDEPMEIVCFADPLLQPHAYFPVVTITSPADGSTLSGIQQIAASAAPAGTKVLQQNLDLFIDGRLIEIGNSFETVVATRTGSGFQLDTTTLSDGWHELRVVAYNNDPIKTQGEKRITFLVNNNSQSVSFSGPASVNVTSTANFTVTPQGLSDITSLIIQSNGRTIATLPNAGGTITVNGSLAPLSGNWLLYAIAQRANGQQVWSAPLVIPVTTTALPAVANATPGTGLANIRFFANSTASNFNWDTTTPDAVSVYNGDVANEYPTPYFSITPASTAFTTALPWPSNTNGNYVTEPGIEASTWYYAATTSWYEFANYVGDLNYGSLTGNLVSLSVDGQALNTWDSVYGPVYLAAGWHAVKVRVQVLSTNFSWQMYARGGISNDYIQFNPQTVAATNGTNPNITPAITSVTASPQVVTGTTAQLQATASVPSGGASSLTYTWSLLSGPVPAANSPSQSAAPGNVSFSQNGSNAASTTTVTFPIAGQYVFLVQVSGPGGQAVAQTATVVVQQTPAGVKITCNPSVVGGGYVNAYASDVDQFGYQVPVTPTTAGQPVFQWSTTPPGATITPESTDADQVRIVFPDSSSQQSYTIKVTGTNGVTGSGVYGVTVGASSPPTLLYGGIYLSSINPTTQQASFYAYYSAPNDPEGSFTNVQWTLTSQPPGSSAVLNPPYTDDYSGGTTHATSTPLVPGAYAVQLSVTDETGAGFTTSYSFAINAAGNTVNPVTFTGSGLSSFSLNTIVGDAITLNPSFTSNDPGTTYQWQISTNNGATWQNLSGQTAATLTLGPLTLAQNGTSYRLLVTNAAGTVTEPGDSTINVASLNGNGGLFELGSTNTILTFNSYTLATQVSESAGSLNLVVHRLGSTVGAVSVNYQLSPATATLGTNYLGVGGGTQISGTLNWADGDGSDKPITIPIVNSPSITSDTTFYVSLSSPSSTATADPLYQLMQVTICNNNDHYGTLSFAPASYSVYKNGGGSVTLNVQRTGSNVGTTDAIYSTSNGSALAGTDYTATSGTLTWANGDSSTKQISVPITQSTINTGPKTFTVSMVANTYSITGYLLSTATVNILDLPYEQWVRQWFGSYFPAQQPVYSSFNQAIQNTSPFVYFPLNETSGNTATGFNASGTAVVTGTYSVSGASTGGSPGAQGLQTSILTGSGSANPGSAVALNTAAAYTVSLDLGNRPNFVPSGNSVIVNLIAGNTVIGTQTFAPQTVAPSGGWANASFTIPSSTLTANYSALNGQSLSIQLLNTSSPSTHLDFTNLSVTSSVSGKIFLDDFSEFTSTLQTGLSYTAGIPAYTSALNTIAWRPFNPAVINAGYYFGVDLSTTNGYSSNPGDTTSTVSAYVTGGAGVVIGVGSYALGGPGPQSPQFPGFSSTNTAVSFGAGGASQTPSGPYAVTLPIFNNGASLNVGTLNGFSSYLTKGFSVSAWVKTTTNNKVMALMGCNNLSGVTTFQVLLNEDANGELAPDNILLYLRADNYFDSFFNSVPLTGLPTGKLSDGNWHQITLVMPPVSANGTYATFYFDGSPVSQLNELGNSNLLSTDTFANFNAGLCIGASYEGTGSVDSYFNGSLDAVSFYATTLSSSQISNIYQAEPPTADPTVSAPSADANGDGVSNLLAYALGLSPYTTAQPYLPVGSIQNNYLTLDFPYQQSAIDITYHVQASNDLHNWTEVWNSTGYQPTGNSSGTTLTIPDTVPISSANQRFMRLEITQP